MHSFPQEHLNEEPRALSLEATMDSGEYDPTFDKSEILDCKDLITRIKEPHAWPSFTT
uniref:Uncharacterized protein n=1 Tax=Brassica oleracea TaxID=3712 RepID=A0A3P6FB56_BRAOL|nr:unnamed protein product [Brassica oleracea]